LLNDKFQSSVAFGFALKQLQVTDVRFNTDVIPQVAMPLAESPKNDSKQK
jgi:hypothetical protein